ncbi:uncharacterized protein YdhG (YjbR/CyaY superfamily) [Neolewinella xylanilytica]|uniref:Uncharacterized protein YdhG (YjbR/CyaY superfamily) n=1 Tax=Neolewinella xylanilytica TaxID=1514080 RepID=A0A2S6I036_9BACT|nr:DUF1801 domain-containing protein [Neolewinella xylanilytica]PPK84221.1 uncharacterized protein YdhG (YjbR/CyaY superfamily) [Neolewinella xylanilytica]
MVKTGRIDQYIEQFPRDTQAMLQQIRELIQSTAAAAEETISYGIPSFRLNGRYLIHFAAYKHHIGMYPVPTGKEFAATFSAYKTSGKGAIHFPLDRPLPEDLIRTILQYRISTLR